MLILTLQASFSNDKINLIIINQLVHYVLHIKVVQVSFYGNDFISLPTIVLILHIVNIVEQILIPPDGCNV